MFPVFGMVSPLVAGILLIIVLILFGPGKLGGLGKALGQTVQGFRSETETPEEKKDNNAEK